MSVRDLIIIGAGPSGLSAAIAAKHRGIDYVVLEQGVLVNSIYRFPPQMVFFTTPELLEIGGLPLVSPYDKPTRTEALRYYRRVVDAFGLQISIGEKVTSVTPDPDHRDGDGRPVFAVESVTARGRQQVRYAHHVVFAIGYYDHPVRLGIPGEELPHVHHYYGEAHAHYRQRVVIVGGGNSAAEAALELHRAGAHVTVVHRRPSLKRTIKYWVRPDIENRIKEGSIAAHLGSELTEIRPASVVVQTIPGATDDEVSREREIVGDADASHEAAAPITARIGESAVGETKTTEVAADAVYLLTGYRADAALMESAGVRLTERQAPVHDSATYETNVPGVFVAGGAIAGVDTGTVFIENGRFHGQKIVDTIAARLDQLG